MYCAYLCVDMHVPSNRLISSVEGADGRREAADPSLLWVSELLRLQHPSDGESLGWGRRHLLWLQRTGPGGQRGVSREEVGGKEEEEERGCVWMCEHMWVFTSMPRTKKCAQPDSCPLFHSRGPGGSFVLQNICLPTDVTLSEGEKLLWTENHHNLKSIVLASEGLALNRGYTSGDWSCESHKCKAVLGWSSAVTDECCFYWLTSTLTAAATEEHQACGQIEIMSKTGHGPVLNFSPILFPSLWFSEYVAT